MKKDFEENINAESGSNFPDKLDNFGDNLSSGRNEHTFSSTNQPENRGRKKTKHIAKLMEEMGRNLAPENIRNHDTIRQFLEQNGLRGTVDEVFVARLYSLALYAGDTRAMKLILDTRAGSNGGGKNKFTVNFISPGSKSSIEVGPNGELTSDPWTIAPGSSN